MDYLLFAFEDDPGLRKVHFQGTVLGTLREDEYLVARVDPPLSGDYLDREEPIPEILLVPVQGKRVGAHVEVDNRYFNTNEGIQEVLAGLLRHEIPPALSKIPIMVTCVVSPDPYLPRKVNERRLKKIGHGCVHSDPAVALGRLPPQKRSLWSRLFGK